MNRLKIWLLAARPRTLTASVSPVVVAWALAFKAGSFHIIPALFCMLVAMFAQIAANFANDYFDYKSGADGAGRTGPKRAVASGWVTPAAMMRAVFISLSITAVCGLGAILYNGDYRLIALGIVIGVCVIAYSAGPYPFAYHGLGDVAVLLFYGIVPVCFTYYVLAGEFRLIVCLLSVAVGLLSVNILLVNNYRDYTEDSVSGKRTTIVIFGRSFGRYFYLFNCTSTLVLTLAALRELEILPLVLFSAGFIAMSAHTYYGLNVKDAQALNTVLGHTARNALLYAVAVSALLANMSYIAFQLSH
ncbi:1,4-dihydroxy-2-naphthoate polyprenyltransferase [Deferribacterales bacterium RsTz2092]